MMQLCTLKKDFMDKLKLVFCIIFDNHTSSSILVFCNKITHIYNAKCYTDKPQTQNVQ